MVMMNFRMSRHEAAQLKQWEPAGDRRRPGHTATIYHIPGVRPTVPLRRSAQLPDQRTSRPSVSRSPASLRVPCPRAAETLVEEEDPYQILIDFIESLVQNEDATACTHD